LLDGVALGERMNSRVPLRAFLAWVDKGALPVAGGSLEQPYAMWRMIEEMYAGYSREKASREAARQDAMMRAMQQR